jgi:hypothetical protein
VEQGDEIVRLLLLFICVVAAASFAQQPSAPGPSPAPKSKNEAQVLQQQEFSSAVADALVGRIGEGLAGHNRKTLLSAFDKDNFQDYTAMKEQVNALMDAYRSFRVHYHVDSFAPNPDGTATIHSSFQLEQAPSTEYGLPIRRDANLTLIASRTKGGWRVIGYTPENFFIAPQ